uniref:Uncharacterized protein n=1 Tax=Ditylenchus dipsaci TaxID=166011 RepID=A0A915DEP1_9BILA
MIVEPVEKLYESLQKFGRICSETTHTIQLMPGQRLLVDNSKAMLGAPAQLNRELMLSPFSMTSKIESSQACSSTDTNNTSYGPATQSDSTALYLQQTIVAIQNVDHLISEKKHELEVYNEAKQELESGSGDMCMVFIGCNLFVKRTKLQGRQMLTRMIGERQRLVENLEKQKNGMQKRFEMLNSVNKKGLVDIREVEDKPVEAKGRRRIAHKPKTFEKPEEFEKELKEDVKSDSTKNPKLEEKVAKKDDQPISQKPEGVSDKDFNSFMKIMKELAVEEEDAEEESLSDISEVDEQEQEVKTNAKKKVQFTKEIEQEATMTSNSPKVEVKPILKNKDILSPVDNEAVKKMDDRGVKKLCLFLKRPSKTK